jgi:hypothetical protein
LFCAITRGKLLKETNRTAFLQIDQNGRSTHNHQTMGSGTHHPSTMNPDKLPLKFLKPDKSLPEVVWDGGFAIVTVVLNFYFFYFG